MLKDNNNSFEGKIVVISGSGNVATYAAEKATELGAKVVAMSDSNGYVYDKNGIDLDAIKKIKLVDRKRIKEYVNIIYSEDEIQDKLAELYNTALSSKNKEIEENDSELAAEAEQYENEVADDENSAVEELDPTRLPGVEEEIIPPSEEESDVVDAGTVEIIDEADISDNLDTEE